MTRISKPQYYVNIAMTVASRGTCNIRNYGAVIVKDDRIVSTGYTGSARGFPNCIDSDEKCERMRVGVPSGVGFGTSSCPSVHAEMNAIINASVGDMNGAVLYLACIPSKFGLVVRDPEPCPFCRRMILNTGIVEVIAPKIDGTLRAITRSQLAELERQAIDEQKSVKT